MKFFDTPMKFFDTNRFDFNDDETSFKMVCYLKRIQIKNNLVWVLSANEIYITNEENRGKGLFRTIILYLEEFCKKHSIPLYIENIINDDLWKKLNKNGYHIIYGFDNDSLLTPKEEKLPERLSGDIKAIKFYKFDEVVGK